MNQTNLENIQTPQVDVADNNLVLPSLGPKNLLLVGCGPAAKRNYIPFLETLRTPSFNGITTLTELEASRPSVEDFFKRRTAARPEIIYLPNSYRISTELPDDLKNQLNQKVQRGEIDGVLIVSEPKSHLPYLKWAIDRGLPVLLEKPLSSPANCCIDENAAKEIWTDYELVDKLLAASPNAAVHVMAQRRAHAGFRFVSNYLREMIERLEVPITFIDVFKSDGLWTFPHEYQKENHPFKYGYGMLMHGGYHFIDTLAQMLSLNEILPDKFPNNFQTQAMGLWPQDAMAQVNERDYAKLFNGYDSPGIQFDSMGELDCRAILRFMRDHRTITNAKISVMHNGFSQRAWETSKSDVYKGNGRLRHERLHVGIGPFLNLMVHSYQSFEESGPLAEEYQHRYNDYSAGGRHHFEVQIFKNSNLLGGQPFESFSGPALLGEIHSSPIQDARKEIIRGF